MAGRKKNTIVVKILGNVRDISKSIRRASIEIGTLNQRLNRGLAVGFFAAGAAAGVFGAAAVAAGAIGAAAMLGMVSAIVGVGVAFAAQNKKVKAAWKSTGEYIKDEMRGIVKPLVKPLVDGAEKARKAFDALAPTLKNLMKQVGPVLTDVFNQMVPIAKSLGPLLTEGFRVGLPVFKAFIASIKPLIDGLTGFFKSLDGGAFASFVTLFMGGISELLPAFGRMINALTPVGTEIINVLLPALVRFADYVADKVVPAAKDMANWVKENEALVKRIAAAFAILFGAFKIVGIFTNIAAAIGILTSPIGILVAVVAALAAGFIYLWNNNEGFKEAVLKAWAKIKEAVAYFVENVWPKVVEAFNGVKAWWDQNGPAITAKVQEVFNNVVEAFKTVKQWWDENGPTIIAKVKEVFESFKKDAQPVINEVVPTLKAAFELIQVVMTNTVAAIKSTWATVGPYLVPLITGVFGGIAKIIQGAIQVIRGVIQVITGLIKGDWSKIWTGIKTILSGVWNIMTGIVKSAVAQTKFLVSSGMDALKGTWNKAWDAVKSKVSEIWNGIKTGVSNGVTAVVNKVGEIKGKITSKISGAGNWLVQTGRDLIQGMINGVKAMAGQLGNAAASVVEGAISRAKSVLGINSPSRVFMKIGNQTGEGLAIGLTDMANRVNRASASLASTTVSGYGSPVLGASGRFGATAGGNTYNLTVHALDPRSAGSVVVDAIREHERYNGAGWRS